MEEIQAKVQSVNIGNCIKTLGYENKCTFFIFIRFENFHAKEMLKIMKMPQHGNYL